MKMQPCLFVILLQEWIKAIAQVFIESGMEAQLAQQRAHDSAIAVLGFTDSGQGFDEEM
jgi:hypothetical protein